MRACRLLIALFDAALVVLAAVAAVVVFAVAKERRDAKRAEDVRTLLGVVAPPRKKN